MPSSSDALPPVGGRHRIGETLRDVHVHTAHNPRASFPSVGSFWFLHQPGRLPLDARVDNALLEERIQAAVTAELEAKGFHLSADGPPDLLVGYAVSLVRPVDAATLDDHFGYPDDWHPEPENGKDYEKGSLILDISDGHTGHLIWRGKTEADVIVAAPAKERETRVNALIAKMLDLYPPDSLRP